MIMACLFASLVLKLPGMAFVSFCFTGPQNFMGLTGSCKVIWEEKPTTSWGSNPDLQGQLARIIVIRPERVLFLIAKRVSD